MKKLILVTSPPACGKTFISKELSKALKNIVYLDKDTLIPLSKRIFVAANEEYNRSSDFFQANIRDYEYDVVLDLAFEALDYANMVLINAPFTDEIRDLDWMEQLRKKLASKGAELVLIWVETDPETCRQRMIARNSDRDTWKLENWDEYISGVDFSRPENIPELVVFDNSSDEGYKAALEKTANYILNK